MAQQLSTVIKKLEKLEVAALGTSIETPFVCGICGGPHENHMRSLIRDDQQVEQANYMGNQQRPPYPQPPFPPQNNLPPPPQPKPQPNSFETALEKLTLTTTGFVQTTNNFIEEARANFRNQESAIGNLETQVGQIAKQLSTALPNPFPSDTQVNP
ncbi:hypothetical protein PIB30_045833 [Stylosanthes scabra]|uniref:Reverse transcriptase domain-containing protein n=1 Tax=Stylosanthes scabra TaxID=79078 RepID=A0ABU6UID5_9FABA|nr:hypothetical protein [Stylosanthes scabra]